MRELAAIALGGATGALLRFWVSNGVHALLGRGFPYGTLTVNILGSFSMGIFTVLLLERLSAGPEWRAAILIGILGAFTTFSTFSMETLNLVEQGEPLKAAANMFISMLACVAAAWLGLLIGRQI